MNKKDLMLFDNNSFNILLDVKKNYGGNFEKWISIDSIFFGGKDFAFINIRRNVNLGSYARNKTYRNKKEVKNESR